jgi:hypothetical protein
MARDNSISPDKFIPAFCIESGFDTSATNGPWAKGLNQISYEIRVGMGIDDATWANFPNLPDYEQMKWVAKYFKGKISKGMDETDVYCLNLGGGAAGKPDSFVIYKKDDPNTGKYYVGNSGLDKHPEDNEITKSDLRAIIDAQKGTRYYDYAKEQLSAAAARIDSGTDDKTVTSTTGPEGGEIVEEVGIMTGSMEVDGQENKDPLKQLGRNLSVDDSRLVATSKIVEDMNRQIQNLCLTPPLVLLINPRSFTRSYEHSIDYAGGWRGQITSIWLEKPISISGSGSTASQYVLSPDGYGGLSNTNRVYSLSYQNLMSLMMTYRNNGWIYSGGTSGETNVGVPVLGLNVFIYYDGHIYLGSFDSFSITESADKPFNMDYSFEFTARYDLATDDIAGEALAQGASQGLGTGK